MILLYNVAIIKNTGAEGTFIRYWLWDFFVTNTVRDNPHLLPRLKDEGEATNIIIYKVYIMLTCNIALIVCILAYTNFIAK